MTLPLFTQIFHKLSVTNLLDVSVYVLLHRTETSRGKTESHPSERSSLLSHTVQTFLSVSPPAVSLFFREHPQDEAAFAVRFKGGGDNGVLAGRQFESVTHLPQVDEVLTASHSRPPQQHVRAQVDVTATFILTTEEEGQNFDIFCVWVYKEDIWNIWMTDVEVSVCSHFHFAAVSFFHESQQL